MATEKMEFDLIINGTPAQIEIKKVKNSIDDLGESAKQSSSIFESSWLTVGAKVAAAGYAIKKAFDFAKEIDTLKTRLETATGSADNAKNKFAELDTMATKMGLSTESLVETYSSFRMAADLAGSSSANTEKIFKSVATAASAMKLSAQDTTGVFMALTQMLSKGTVSSEELRQQFGERIPGAMSLAAKAMNMTDAEFNKALGTGQIMANDLLPKLADALENKFAKGAENASNSLQASYNRLGNTFTNVKEIIYNSLQRTGIIEFFSKAVTSIDSFIDRIARATTSIRQMSMTQRDVERLDIIKQIADKEKQIEGAFEFNKGRYQSELRNLKSKLALIDELNKKEQASINATKQEAKKSTPLVKTDKKAENLQKQWADEQIRLQNEVSKAGMDAKQKELADLDAAMEIEINKYKTIAGSKEQIEAAFAAKRSEINRKYFDKETDDIFNEIDKQFKGLGTSAEQYAKETEDIFNQIDISFGKNVTSDEQRKKDLASAMVSLETRTMAANLLTDEKAKTLELANIEYDKNIANLNYQKALGLINDENYSKQTQYLLQTKNKIIEDQTEMAQLMKGIASQTQSAFTSFFDITSKKFLNFKSLAMDILNAIMQKMIVMNIVNPMMTSFGFKMSAKGNVFDGGNMQRFASGGVVNSTQQFRFAGGAGIMGEKGSEAIMPLKRMTNGDLGVSTSTQPMKVQIINESGEKMQVTSSSVGQDTEGMVLGIVINAVNTNKSGMRDMLRGVR